MNKIGVGVNEYVVLAASNGKDYAMQSHGLSGCVLVIITDALFSYMAHVSRLSGGEAYYNEQTAGLESSIRSVEFHNPSITILGQRTPFDWSPNMKRLAALTKNIFPTATCTLVNDKGAYVGFNFARGVFGWEIIGSANADFSGNINTVDAAKVGITCGIITPESQVCRSSSIYGTADL